MSFGTQLPLENYGMEFGHVIRVVRATEASEEKERRLLFTVYSLFRFMYN
jgi:hypothetical protein